jgi:hypothetical protein
MKCPHCHEDLPCRECPDCHAKTPVEGSFCAFCGSELPDSDATVEAGNGEFDFSDRVLCSDGMCIGLINEQGVCNECGKPYAEEAE